jgi:hypothetical protein
MLAAVRHRINRAAGGAYAPAPAECVRVERSHQHSQTALSAENNSTNKSISRVAGLFLVMNATGFRNFAAPLRGNPVILVFARWADMDRLPLITRTWGFHFATIIRLGSCRVHFTMIDLKSGRQRNRDLMR